MADTGCQGQSYNRTPRLGRCQARPIYSVSEHLDQRTDRRCCGRHLSWLVAKLTEEHGTPVVVARLIRG